MDAIRKRVKLVELFGGIGTQAMALRNIGADFDHHVLVENDKYAVESYNEIHGTAFVPLDIRAVHGKDLRLDEQDKYTYIMTYSFPCVDLSVSGKMAGMGEGTRSGLLWEVKRILEELPKERLPEVLVMENVVQVHGKRNKELFDKWLSFLDSLGYVTSYADLNAVDYGCPQHRVRCFAVSVRKGRGAYFFPKGAYEHMACPHLVMADVLESHDKVNVKHYYRNKERLDPFVRDVLVPYYGFGVKKIRSHKESRKIGCMYPYHGGNFSYTVFDPDYVAPTLLTMSSGGWKQPCIPVRHDDGRIEVRRITPREAWRLMGFSDEDYDKARAVQSDSQLYKQAGNAICVPVLEAIFRAMVVR